MKHFLKLQDFTKEEIIELLDLADQLKYERKNNIPHKHLEGKKLGLIFQKSSTRTRVSFEVGMYELGGYPLFLSSKDLQMGRGEPVQDTARVLSRYLDGIMIRTFEQKEVEDLAKYGSIPVINALTDYSHPCQVLADLMTIREFKGSFDGLKIAYIGDGNNVANSVIVGCLRVGMKVSVAAPKGYEPDKNVIKMANDEYPGMFELVNDPFVAAKEADVIFTDVWASMGMESEIIERKKTFEGVYQVNDKIMSVAKSNCMIQHCLPAHRGEEITEEIFENHADEIFEEAENRLHVQKAVMIKLMK